MLNATLKEIPVLGILISTLISIGIFSCAFLAKRAESKIAITRYKAIGGLLLLLCLSIEVHTILFLVHGGWSPASDDLLKSILIGMMLVFQMIFWIYLAKNFYDRKKLLYIERFSDEPHHILYAIEESAIAWIPPTVLVEILLILTFPESTRMITNPWVWLSATYMLLTVMLFLSRVWGNASSEREYEHEK